MSSWNATSGRHVGRGTYTAAGERGAPAGSRHEVAERLAAVRAGPQVVRLVAQVPDRDEPGGDITTTTASTGIRAAPTPASTQPTAAAATR